MVSTNPNSLCFTFFTSPPDTWSLPVSRHMYHIQNGGYTSGLLAMGQATSVLHLNDKASHMALPHLVVETTPCHLSSFVLFPATPVACPTLPVRLGNLSRQPITGFTVPIYSCHLSLSDILLGSINPSR
jgi:hypothetical protein